MTIEKDFATLKTYPADLIAGRSDIPTPNEYRALVDSIAAALSEAREERDRLRELLRTGQLSEAIRAAHDERKDER